LAERAGSRTGLAQALTKLAPFSLERADLSGEIHLYYRRACLAAAEERYDDALVFCGKALALDAGHLPVRLLVARIYDRGLRRFDAALEAYRKVISLAGYDGENRYCAAARQALDLLVRNGLGAERPVSG